MNAPVTHSESTALAVARPAQSPGNTALILDPTHLHNMMALAEVMSRGMSTVPRHLQKNQGDCLAVVMQATQWGMNPFAVAQKTHVVNGTLGYEAQLVNAVVNSLAPTKDRLNYEWFGDWNKVIGKFKEIESKKKVDEDTGKPLTVRVSNWDAKDEAGLGVRVWATMKNEAQPRLLELHLAQCRVRNSPLWVDDPRQQIAYLAVKRWTRLHCPDVLLGVYTPDELAEPGEKFMGAADVVGAPPPPPAPKPEKPEFDDAQFKKRKEKLIEFFQAGKTADEIINFYGTQSTIPEAMAKRIRDLHAEVTKPVTDVEPKVTYAQVADALHKAPDLESLDAAADLINAVADEVQRAELSGIYGQRREAIGASN